MIKIYPINISGKCCEIDTHIELERARKKKSIKAKNLMFHWD